MRRKTRLTRALFAKEGETLAEVMLPHTWNAFDGQDGGNDYWRGLGTYTMELPDPTPGKRQYIELQGANHMATVYCNGRELGTHKGGFSTFRFELTQAMRNQGNVLTVAVSNAKCEIYPQRADFTFCGGVYRDVNFIEVADAHFDLMKQGSDAVFVTPRSSGKTRIDLFPVNALGCTVTVDIRDVEGNVVASGTAAAQDHTVLKLDVKEPHLWNGMEDPYCYTAEAIIRKGEAVLDAVTVTFGYRSFHVSPNDGFWLNGKNVPLRGVSRHQDRQDKGWAISRADQDEDLAIIKEVGANTIRLAHYQHDQYFYDLCDHTGFAIWAEIPFISEFMAGQEAYDNSVSQMTELIAQNYNHPSIFFWGLSNEITIGGDSEALHQNLWDLNALCKKMDPSRLTTMAQLHRVPMDSEHVYISDIQSYNYYFGWYTKTVEDNGPEFDRFHAMNPDRCFGISEYGADCLTKWHSARPMNHDYTEEYANFYHHEMLKTFATRPYLWATYVWNMFDFAADARNEGGDKGRNNKGIVTYDRKVKKDAFYVYKAYWSREPMVHVSGRRFADRAPGERDITVYTNCERVTLLLNGEEVATQEAQDHAAVFREVPLQDGPNTVTARAGAVEDTIVLNGVAVPNSDYVLPELAAALNAGNWFDDAAEDSDSDEIRVLDGFYSVMDKVGELLANEVCLQTVKGWIMACDAMPIGNKLTAVSRVGNWKKTWPERTLMDFNTLKLMTQKDFAQLNRQLCKIRK